MNTGNGNGSGHGHAVAGAGNTGNTEGAGRDERALKVSIVVSGETALGSVLLRDAQDDIGIKLEPDAARTIARGLLEAADEVSRGNACVGRLTSQGCAPSDIFMRITHYYGEKYAMEQAGDSGTGTGGTSGTKGGRRWQNMREH